MFQSKGVSEDVPEVTVALSAEGLRAPLVDGSAAEPLLRAPKLLQLAGLAVSTGEAMRKLNENAVSVNGEKFNGRVLSLDQLGKQPTLRLGKKAVRVTFAP